MLVRSQVVGFKKIKFFTNENVGAGKLELPENEMHTTAFWITLERKLLAELPYALSDRQNGILGLLYAMASMASLLLMCDGRDLGTAVGERPASPGIETEWQEFSRDAGECGGDEGIFRAEFVFIRCISWRDWVQRASVSGARYFVAADAGADCRMPLREWVPFLRGACGGEMREDEGSGAGDSGAVVCVIVNSKTLAAETQRAPRKTRESLRRARSRGAGLKMTMLLASSEKEGDAE